MPLNDCAVVALDYQGTHGIATALGHAVGVRDWPTRGRGSEMAITEALTNIVFAPIDGGLRSVSLSANWMWPCQERGRGRAALRGRTGGQRLCGGPRNQHTDRQGFAVDDAEVPRRRARLRAGNGHHHFRAAEVSDVKKAVSPASKHRPSQIVYVDMSRSPFALGGSSFFQSLGGVGSEVPAVESAD